MIHNLKLLARLWWEPAAAMSDILDRGSMLFASLAVVVVSIVPSFGPVHFSFYQPLLLLAVVYVPGILLIGGLLGLNVDFRRDYSSLLTCTAMSWTAAMLPVMVVSSILPTPAITMLGGLYFLALIFFALRTVFGAGNGTSVGVICLSWLPLVAVGFLWGPLSHVIGFLASPFFLFYAYYYLSGELSGLGDGLRSRQNQRRMLEAAAINPHDAEAQYQLGLIHQERRQYGEAIARFEAAIKIDWNETDSHFQLGRIAREQGRIDDALKHFQTVLTQDPKHKLSEILRELAAVHWSLGRFEEARRELETFIGRWPYDAEGLFYYGRTLESLNDPATAREMYERAVEAVRTAPRYRQRIMAQWSRLAQKQLGRLPKL